MTHIRSLQQNSQICGPFPTNGTCDCYSGKCMSVIDMLYSIHNTTVPWKECVDHDSRCQVMKSQICSANAPEHTKKFAIKTCPSACNYCRQYSVITVSYVIVGNQATQVQSTTPTTTHMITTSVITTHVETATPTTTHVPTTTPTTTHEPTTTPTTTHEPTTSPTTTHEPTTSPTTTHEPTTSPTTTNLQTTTPTTTHMISTTPTTPVAFLSSSVSASQNVNTQGPPCEDKPEVDCTLFVSSNICNVPTAKIYCAKTCTHCMPVDVVNGHLVG
ncbi:unnamed protein product [Mytilus coruscus]|uniref:ShKT domain-containing protein n=1 Tax=Mytilus coruscus TaxID=42192 RepID=A0A6J8EAG3_MYTCO|nr:unnamed protein product [Mytilus coruscus]